MLDGALATELEARGFDLSGDLWSARLLADDPGAIEDVHVAYLEAGAQVITTASYQASLKGLTARGFAAADAVALLRRSVELARRATERAGRPDAVVAASVGPYGAVLADGREYTGEYGDATDADVERFHERRLRILLEARPDCLACETIPRASEAAALARVLDRLDAPDAWISFSCADGRTTAHGEPIEAAIELATSSPRVVAVGVNCTSPEHVDELLGRARAVTGLPLVAYPNNGRVWDGAARCWTDEGTSSLPAETVRGWAGAGARLVGGCCGLGPAAVANIVEALAARPAPRSSPEA